MAKIATVVPYKIYPYHSGGQKSIALFYRFFSGKKDITLICTSNNSKPANVNYEIAPLLGKSVLRYINPFLYFKIKTFVIQHKISVVIFEQPYFGWLAYLIKKFLKVKIVIRSHNIEALRFKSLHKWWWKIMWQYEKFTYAMADFNFFIQQNDQDYAVEYFKLKRVKTAVITSGITWNKPPGFAEKQEAKNKLTKLHGLQSELIIFFNGAFDYKPNADALHAIIYSINPQLALNKDLKYKIIVCGKSIPKELMKQTFNNIILAGFAKDIEVYYKAADIFINPVNDGGGIKTKLVEALGYNITSVSTKNGAIGIDINICNGKLLLAESNADFADKIKEAIKVHTNIGEAFYNHFYWPNIIDKAINIIDRL